MGQPTTNGAGRARTQGIIRSARVWLAASQGCCWSYSHITYPPPMDRCLFFLSFVGNNLIARIFPEFIINDGEVAVLPSTRVFDRSGNDFRRVYNAIYSLFHSFFTWKKHHGSLNISKFNGTRLPLILIGSEARGMHSLARGLCPYGALHVLCESLEHLIQVRYHCSRKFSVRMK